MVRRPSNSGRKGDYRVPRTIRYITVSFPPTSPPPPKEIQHLAHIDTGKRGILVTNNSTKSRAKQSLRFRGMGIPASEDQIFTSAYSTAIYLSQILHMSAPRNKVFVFGQEGIEAELASVGLVSIGGTDKVYQKEVDSADLRGIASGAAMDDNVGAVVVGSDSKFNYLKLCYAMQYIARGAHFLATDRDPTYPAFGTVFPAAGCISAMLVAMLKVEPLLLGKPSQEMMRAIQSRYELDLKRTCMVGDRLDSDIRFGIECGLGGTLLVLTGVTHREDLEGIDPRLLPSAYVEALSDLLA